LTGSSKGFLLISGAAILWAIGGVVAKLMFRGDMDPTTLVTARLTSAFVVLLLVLAVRNRASLTVKRRSFLSLAGIGLCWSFAQWAYYVAISATSVATAVFLQCLAPIVVAACVSVSGRERIGKLHVGVLALATAGSYLLVTGGTGSLQVNTLGVAAGLSSAAAYALYIVMAKEHAGSMNAWTFLLYTLCSGSLAWNLFHPGAAMAVARLDVTMWVGILYLTLAATLLPFGMYLHGLSLLTASRASVSGMIEPVAAGAIAYFVLGERLSLFQGAGGLLIAAAVIALQLRGAGHPSLRTVSSPHKTPAGD